MNADVVVVGGGGAGLAAAIGAAAAGADVALLEKNPALGGTTAHSIGSITATRTPHQARLGIVDTPEEHLRDLSLFTQHAGRPDNEKLCKILTDNVPDTLRWLAAAGVEFFGPMEEPPHKKPRMHNVLPNSRAYIFHLERQARKAGVRILTQARARRLVVEGGAVTGVEFDRPDDEGQVIHASRGVVLASGDYAANPEMKRQLISDAVARTEATNPTSTGDGQRMALEVGARIVNGDMFGGGTRFVRPPRPSWISKLPPSRWLMRPVNLALRYAPQSIVRRFVMGFLTTVMVPERGLFDAGAILVNRNGERFADESQSMIVELAYQPEALAYILLDGGLAAQFSKWPHYISTAPGIAFAYLPDYEKNRPDLVHKADTLEELAVRIGADPVQLVATVERYNASDESGPSASGLPASMQRAKLRASPFYALGPVKNYINFTDGGLAVNERLEVLDSNGNPISGLYAAGSVGQGGLLLKGHGHHLGWAFTSGRLAGKYAAGRNGS